MSTVWALAFLTLLPAFLVQTWQLYLWRKAKNAEPPEPFVADPTDRKAV